MNEFEILQNQLVQISKEKQEYENKVEEMTKQNEQIPFLKLKVEELEKQNEKDEMSQMNELKEATMELNAVRNELNSLNNPQENRKMKKLEAQLEAITTQEGLDNFEVVFVMKDYTEEPSTYAV